MNNKFIPKKSLSCIAVFCALSAPAFADTYIRYNHAGYTPDRNKEVLVMADTNSSTSGWTLKKEGNVVASGTLGASLVGKSFHTAKPFNYKIDLSSINIEGDYTLAIAGGDSATIKIDSDPYSFISTEILTHMRAMRSGTSDTLSYRVAAHMQDSQAPVNVPDGATRDGRWKKANPSRTLNMLGGWYDAGDYIKFTLTNAYTCCS